MTVVRRDITANPAVRDQYIRGVKLLKQEVPQPRGSNTYDLFVIWHVRAMNMATPAGSDRNAAHRGPVFLPWHRHMLIELERALQRVLNDNTFGLPYWNWGRDGDLSPGAQRTARIWRANCMGGDGNPVSTGPFRSSEWRVRVATDSAGNLITVNRGLRRSFAAAIATLPTRAAARAAAALPTYDAAPWSATSSGALRNQLEGWLPNPPDLHNRVHVWVGGDMLIGSSPNDPVFYLNHCNVDRIWASWQRRHPGSPYRPRQTDPGAPVGHRVNDPVMSIFPPAPTPAQLLNVGTIYRYDTLSDL